MAENKDDYEVGYGKPPKENQFTKGKSGNAKGRPKGSKNFATSFAAISSEKIRVSEGGKTRMVTKGHAVIQQLAAKALSGNLRAMQLFIDLDRAMDVDVSDELNRPATAARDAQIKAAFFRMIRQQEPESKSEPLTNKIQNSPKDNQ